MARDPGTPTVHRLLEHLRAHGVPGVPEPHGLDQRGREVLEFLPGEVPSYPMPGWVWNDGLLVAAAKWLRRFHDVTTTDLLRGGERWLLPDHPPVEVICHNDFAPYNMVFDAEHRLVGVIDFDTCSPRLPAVGSRVPGVPDGPVPRPRDIAEPNDRAGQRIERLELLCDSYGPPVQPGDVLAMLAVRVRDPYDFTAVRAAEAGPASELHRHLSSYEVDLAYLDELTTDE